MPKRCAENKHQFFKFVPAYVEAPLYADLRTQADFRKKNVKIVRMDESRMKIICRKCGYDWISENKDFLSNFNRFFMAKTKLEIMSPDHKRWKEFTKRLEGEERFCS